ncbi:MAG: protein phosphatase CheZ [Halomonadaceae bacterium]|nr:MAG: protein phosphatase CheZ [Halomonadaceae bacterium]
MNEADNQAPGMEYEKELLEQVGQLKDEVEAGDMAAAMRRIADMGEERDQTLYLEVGRLTRSLHEALRNFHIQAGNEHQRQALSRMGDASDRLGYVVELTSKSANRTMDLVEASMPLASQIQQEGAAIRSEWQRLGQRDMKAAEFRQLYSRIQRYLDVTCEDSSQMYENLSEILLAQDYQDLTGQVIQRVTDLVRDVEDNLVKLMVMASDVDRITGTVHETAESSEEKDKEQNSRGEGPQMNADKRDDVVSGQDDVDDLLSSLGF